MTATERETRIGVVIKKATTLTLKGAAVQRLHCCLKLRRDSHAVITRCMMPAKISAATERSIEVLITSNAAVGKVERLTSGARNVKMERLFLSKPF